MERADDVDGKSRRLFQNGKHLHAVLARRIRVITTTFRAIHIRIVDGIGKDGAVNRAECPESIRRKENLLCLIIGECHFRPVDHRCLDEAELVHAEIQHHLFIRDDVAIFE